MRKRNLAAIVAATPVLITPAVAATDGPTAFLHHLYAPYLKGGTRVSPTGQAAPSIFDTRLTGLIRRDQQAAEGEVGALDQDPVCDCQDFDRLKALRVQLQPVSPGRSRALVSFQNGTAHVVLTYTLVMEPGGWRVADIGSPDMPSLVAFLQKAEIKP